VTASNSANISVAAEQKTSTRAGSNWVPLRWRATAIAEGVLHMRW
jgi:hypothetical protein